jgi:hypothetical protein
MAAHLPPSAPRRRISRAWLLVPFAVAGLAVALAAAWLVNANRPQPVTGVARDIKAIVLSRSATPGLEDGGAIGPWWVSAAGVDDRTNTFHVFRLRSGELRVAAKTARLVIDPEANTISFDLRDVVILRVPERPRDGGDDAEQGLARLDTYLLGPAPYGRRIVHDSALRDAHAQPRLAGAGSE